MPVVQRPNLQCFHHNDKAVAAHHQARLPGTVSQKRRAHVEDLRVEALLLLQLQLLRVTGMECHKLGLVSGLLLMELPGFQQALGLQLSLQLAHLPRKTHLSVDSYVTIQLTN